MMSKKDYSAISQVMVSVRHKMSAEAYEYLVDSMGSAFSEDNDRFSRILWEEACGLGEWK